ncbi:MAG TPA: hypothetical protein VMT44_00450, partial [Methanoregula sp.]|nr:hypothetical protein [Methanoregula sp.]
MNEPARRSEHHDPVARGGTSAPAAIMFVTILAVLASFFLAAPAAAAVITVNGSSGQSLQQLADSAGAGDTILLAPGTYPGSLVINHPVTIAALDPASPPVLVAGVGTAGI